MRVMIYQKFPRSASIYMYVCIFVCVCFRFTTTTKFPKTFLTDSQLTHISALKADTNTLSQSPCKARPQPTIMIMSQNITLPVFITTTLY